MNDRQPTHLSYNQQVNNRYNDRRSVHSSRTQMTFNGPIHGYIEHVTGDGPVVAYSQVTYIDRGYTKPTVLNGTTLRAEQTRSPASATPQPRFPIESDPKDELKESDDLGPLISPSIPLPIERSVLEAEFRTLSPEMQKYVRYLLRRYEKSYTEAEKNGQACETNQR